MFPKSWTLSHIHQEITHYTSATKHNDWSSLIIDRIWGLGTWNKKSALFSHIRTDRLMLKPLCQLLHSQKPRKDWEFYAKKTICPKRAGLTVIASQQNFFNRGMSFWRHKGLVIVSFPSQKLMIWIPPDQHPYNHWLFLHHVGHTSVQIWQLTEDCSVRDCLFEKPVSSCTP